MKFCPVPLSVTGVLVMLVVKSAPVPGASVTVQGDAVAVRVWLLPVRALDPNANGWVASARLPAVNVTEAVSDDDALAVAGNRGSRAAAAAAAIASLRARTGISY